MKWIGLMGSRNPFVSRWWATHTAVIVVAGALVALLAVVGLALPGEQPSAQPTPATPAAVTPGRSTSTLTKQEMKIAANGTKVQVYPADPLHPFDSTVWFAEVPVIVTAVDYDPRRKELYVSVDYNWSKSEEDALRFQLAEQSKHAGKPISEKAFTIATLDVAAFSLLIRDMDSEYLLFSTEKSNKLTPQTVPFRLPEMVPGVNRLHERLASKPETVQLVLRAGYRFDRIAGLTIERRALNSAWETVLETVIPNAATQARPLLVDRNAEQALHAKLAAAVLTVIKSYGLTPGEEKETLELAMKELEKLKLPTEPLTVKELLELIDANLVFTPGNGKIESKPAMNEEAITKLKEYRSSSEKVFKAAEQISDIANNTEIDDRKFHSLARGLVLKAGASGGFGPWSAKANMHLDKQENEITENHMKEIKNARTYAMNKSAYTRDVQDSYGREIEGLLKKSEPTAQLLNLRRVSVAALVAQGSMGVHLMRITGSEVLFFDTPIALKATPIHPDALLALKERVTKIEQEPKLDTASFLVVGHLGQDKSNWKNHKYVVGANDIDPKHHGLYSVLPISDWLPAGRELVEVKEVLTQHNEPHDAALFQTCLGYVNNSKYPYYRDDIKDNMLCLRMHPTVKADGMGFQGCHSEMKLTIIYFYRDLLTK